jgi:ABC-type glycerol-3-phosphate transport system permease component
VGSQGRAGRQAAGSSPGQARTTSIAVLMAGSFISAVPAIVVYLIFQRYLVRGLTLGMGK